MYRSQRHDALEYDVKEGDLYERINVLIRARTAPLHLIHLAGKEGKANKRLMAAVEMARIAADQPPPDAAPEWLIADVPSSPPIVENDIARTVMSVSKVTTTVPQPVTTAESAPPRKDYPEAHRGRDQLKFLQERNRQRVLDASSPAKFWKEIRRVGDPAPDPVCVSAEQLRSTFESRLNPPPELPEQFNDVRHKLNQFLAEQLPKRTGKETTSPILRRPIT
ncbi:hypothetical protein BDZ89DRAFT_1201536, partial [Hymenopellis radicata]